MSRNQSTSLFSQSPPAIISRGFASLRRAHQRISTSPPSSDSLSTRSLDSTEQRRPFIRLVPQVGLSGRSFVFDVVERELEPGVVYKIGRCLENDESVDNFSFQSKVVSRNHAEIWTENEKV